MRNQDKSLRDLAAAIESILPEIYGHEMGFALLVFPFNHPSGDYISNAERSDMINTLRETADRIERNAIIPVTQGTA